MFLSWGLPDYGIPVCQQLLVMIVMAGRLLVLCSELQLVSWRAGDSRLRQTFSLRIDLVERRLVFVTGPPGPQNWGAPPQFPAPPRSMAQGGAFFFSTPAPAPVRAPAPFNALNSPPAMNFLRPGPRFFVYSPLEHCSFDT